MGISEKFRRIFNKHHILVHFTPSNTVRHKCVHPKDKTPRHKQSNVCYAVQCNKDCKDLYIGKQNNPYIGELHNIQALPEQSLCTHLFVFCKYLVFHLFIFYLTLYIFVLFFFLYLLILSCCNK